MTLSAEIVAAIKSGPVPKLRDWRKLPTDNLSKWSKADMVIAFAETHLRVPDGVDVGKPLKLAPFQEAFLRAVLDNPDGTRTAVLSIARRNGKSFLIAVLVLAALIGPLAERNLTLASAAMSRDQAALVFKMMQQMIAQSPELQAATHIIPSQKKIVGLATGSEYYAMSADAKTGHGRSLKYIVLDEAGQIVGPTNEYIEMLRTSQGSYDNSLFLTISTQAPSDADFLSILIDDATRAKDPHTVCHVYESPKDLDLLNAKGAKLANPGLGLFRSEKDLFAQLEQAKRLPSMQSGAENLLLNRRVALQSLWVAAEVWRENAAAPDLDVFRDYPTAIGLDLSARSDLTAAVLAARDGDGFVHVLPFVFTPSAGVEERAARDRAPYDAWVRDGQMIAIGGRTMDYEQVAECLRDTLEDMDIRPDFICFDRWRIDLFKKASSDVGFAEDAEWIEVGQGFRDFSPRLETSQKVLLEGRMKHGGHPVLNMAAANAIAVKDPAGSTKLDKSKATQRIDPLVALVMAVHAVDEGAGEVPRSYLDDGEGLMFL